MAFEIETRNFIVILILKVSEDSNTVDVFLPGNNMNEMVAWMLSFVLVKVPRSSRNTLIECWREYAAHPAADG